MEEFNAEHLEEVELDQFEENVNNIEQVNENDLSTPHSPIDNLKLTEKKDIKWQRSPFPNLNLNLQPIDDIQPEVIGSDMIDPPIKYFSKYYSDVDFQLMVQYTNMYALQKGKTWKNTDIKEIKIFIGLHIIMGCTKFPRIRMYWNLVLKMNVFVENMNRNRFFTLRTNFHVIDNLKINKNNKDKFVKVRPMFDCLKRRCGQLNIEKNVSIDEQMIPFKGQLNIKQYMKGKPCPWGIKNFVMCGASGLMYNFVLYQGKATEFDQHFLKQFGLGGTVVLTLVQTLEINKHFLFFDNYFSGYNLMERLTQKQIYAISTIRENRFAKPPLLNDKIMASKGQGTTDEITNIENTITLVKWYDNKSVNMCSNFIASGIPDTVQRWNKKEKKYVSVERPEIIKLYNQSMGGVDKYDQLISYYRIFLKSKKWTLRMVFHAVDMAITNSWLEYYLDCKNLNIPNKDRMDLLEFRLRLADNLINVGNVNTPKRQRGRPREDSSLENSPSPSPTRAKYNSREVRPFYETKTDLIGHYPASDDNNEATRQYMISKTKKKSKKKRLQSATMQNKAWRYICYKRFTLWVNSWMAIGKGNRVIVPSCVVKIIREHHPEENGLYVGFQNP
ncbi:hypothetical protein QTP88_004670 [Uroleucon formosanum]